jgi:hypothetical protein
MDRRFRASAHLALLCAGLSAGSVRLYPYAPQFSPLLDGGNLYVLAIDPSQIQFVPADRGPFADWSVWAKVAAVRNRHTHSSVTAP